MDYQEYINKLVNDLKEVGFTTDLVKNFDILNTKYLEVKKLLESNELPKIYLTEEIVAKIEDFHNLHHKYVDCLYKNNIDIIDNNCVVYSMDQLLSKHLTSYENDWLGAYLFEKIDGEVKVWFENSDEFVINSPATLVEFLKIR